MKSGDEPLVLTPLVEPSPLWPDLSTPWSQGSSPQSKRTLGGHKVNATEIELGVNLYFATKGDNLPFRLRRSVISSPISPPAMMHVQGCWYDVTQYCHDIVKFLLLMAVAQCRPYNLGAYEPL